MQTRNIQHGNFNLTLSEATTLMGMRRTMLQVQMQKALEGDEAQRILQVITYPDLVGAVVKTEGFAAWPISFADFCDLPEQFTTRWEQAVYELNPHWSPGYDDAEEKKEPMTSASDLPAGTSDEKS